MSVKLAYNRVEQFSDITGVPYSGAKLFTYVGGSVNTKQTTFTESTGTTPNTNPIVLDSFGQLPQPIWLTTGAAYKFVLAPSTDTDPPTSPIWTLDGITGVNDSSASQSEWIAGPTPTFVSATQFTLVGDQTTNFAKSRRVKATVTAGTVFGTITNSAFAASTTVTVALDSGNLDSGLSAVSFGIVSPVNPSISADEVHRKGSAVASAATTDIWSIAGDYVHITGTTPITSLGTAPYAGAMRMVIFDGALTLTHNATTLSLPGGISVTTAANDRMILRADTTANMVVISYIPAAGTGDFRSVQVFTVSGTYTTPAGLKRAKVRLVGGGGGSGGMQATVAGNMGATGGANGGWYSEKTIPSATIGASQTVTIGAGGTAATAGTNPGGNGGTTSFGAIFSATGGLGSVGATQAAPGGPIAGGAGALVSTISGTPGDFDVPGGAGTNGMLWGTGSNHAMGGQGGNTALGGITPGLDIAGTTPGQTGAKYGGGASGSANGASQSAVAGSAGAPGICIVEEYF